MVADVIGFHKRLEIKVSKKLVNQKNSGKVLYTVNTGTPTGTVVPSGSDFTLSGNSTNQRRVFKISWYRL